MESNFEKYEFRVKGVRITDEKFLFQHDNAPIQARKVMQQFLYEQGLNIH